MLTATCAQAAARPALTVTKHTSGSTRPSGVVTPRGASHSGASAVVASAAADGRTTQDTLVLLGDQSHAADAPTPTLPLSGRHLNAHAAEKAQKRVWHAQAACALGDV